MSLLRITSPHAHCALTTGQVMQRVLLATIPGIAALTLQFGFGTIWNIFFASIFALGFEALAMYLRRRPIDFYLKDYSALVTAFLLGIALPPAAPWWLILIGIGFAILIAKHLYGGLGYNPFNPAMVGYVVLLISFPVTMTTWLAPFNSGHGELLGPLAALQKSLGIANELYGNNFDAVTAATTLDVFKQNNTLLVSEIWQQSNLFGSFGGTGWEWVNAAFLAGGLFLLSQRIFTWHAPVSMLIGLSVMALFFYDGGSANSGGSPLFHLFSGATMFGAFFIVTDPVTSAVSNRGRLIYGFLIGILIYIIRIWGNYPDGVGFAVLLMNFVAPLLDQYTQPRTYGHNTNRQRSNKNSERGDKQ
jgi:electron transport complex protein RnfD